MSVEIPDSLISEAVTYTLACGAVNLASGAPDFPAPAALKEKASLAIAHNHNQYTMNAGMKSLRESLARKLLAFNGINADPQKEIAITCGTAEALFCTLFSLIERGDEVIIFEPAFESYLPDMLMAGGTPRIFRLRPPRWDVDLDELSLLFNDSTKAIILNTPHNPTGKVFSRSELEAVAGLCQKWDVYAITDEIYEYITYDGNEHISMASLPGMAERTITLGGYSKTFNCTGWRIGYAVAPAKLMETMQKVHTYLTVCAPTPFQKALTEAFDMGDDYFSELKALYTKQRDLLTGGLKSAGFITHIPGGAYFVMADFTPFGYKDDLEFYRYLAREAGVGSVPLRAFLSPGSPPGAMVRFSFCKERTVIEEAISRLRTLKKI
jgi:aspartate/methionine/tyrosine aminotransferase